MASDRTEKATPKRREDARKKGQLGRRPELSSAAAFMAALVALKIMGNDMLLRAGGVFKKVASIVAASEPLTIPSVHGMLVDASAELALLTLPIIAAALVGGIVTNFAQGGLALSPSALLPKAERFNPVANLKRVFGSNAPVELLKSLLKLAGISGICYGIFAHAISTAPLLVGAPASQSFLLAGQMVYDLGLRAGAVMLAIAALDYGYGRYQHEKSLRMTKQEVKDEFRQQEGDPMVKSQRRRAGRALSQRRMRAEVPRADVVITNPTHFAVALRYDRMKDSAPVVVAKGADLMAKRIREIAREHDVPIIENPPLARSIYRSVKEGGAIPAELFRAVAELLAYVYRQRQQTAGLT